MHIEVITLIRPYRLSAYVRPHIVSQYSLDELEEMMQGVKRFRTILTEIEQRLDHEQASVYEDLSATDRYADSVSN